MVVSILVSAVHASVTVMVHAAVAHVQLVHHVDYAHDDLWVVCGISVDLHVEDMSAACNLMVRCLHFCLMSCRAFVIHRYVVGVGVIVAVGDARYASEFLSVLLCEFSAEAFRRCGEYGVVMMITFAEVVYALSHVFDNFQAQFLALFAFPVVFSCQCHQAFCQSDESDAKCSLVDNAFDGIFGT